MIKYRFLSEAGGSDGNSPPLFFAYRFKDQLLPLVLSQLADDQLFHALDVAMGEDVDGLGYVKGVLARVASDEDKKAMLRRVNYRGMTTFYRAAWTENRKLKKLELLQVKSLSIYTEVYD